MRCRKRRAGGIELSHIWRCPFKNQSYAPSWQVLALGLNIDAGSTRGCPRDTAGLDDPHGNIGGGYRWPNPAESTRAGACRVHAQQQGGLNTDPDMSPNKIIGAGWCALKARHGRARVGHGR
jgi:hypothetical protein